MKPCFNLNGLVERIVINSEIFLSLFFVELRNLIHVSHKSLNEDSDGCFKDPNPSETVWNFVFFNRVRYIDFSGGNSLFVKPKSSWLILIDNLVNNFFLAIDTWVDTLVLFTSSFL